MKRLYRKTARMIEQADLGGWALLTAGLVLLAVAVLYPVARRLEQERHVHKAVAQLLDWETQRLQRHQRLAELIENNDQRLLYRLAWHQLHWRPAGFRSADGTIPADPDATEHWQDWVQPTTPQPTMPPLRQPAGGERLLAVITTPGHRVWTLLTAGLLAFGGIMFSLRRQWQQRKTQPTAH